MLKQSKEVFHSFIILGFMAIATLAVIMFSCTAHAAVLAQAVAPAASSPSLFSSLWSAIASNISLDLIFTGVVALGIWLGGKYLSAERRGQIATVVSLVYHAAVGVDSMLAPGGAKNVMDKMDDLLAKMDAAMAAHGWKPLTDAQKQIATLQVQALAGKGTVAAALGALSSVPPQTPKAA